MIAQLAPRERTVLRCWLTSEADCPQMSEVHALLDIAISVFGTPEAALQWLETPLAIFDSQSPAQYAHVSSQYAAYVRDVLRRIAAGETFV